MQQVKKLFLLLFFVLSGKNIFSQDNRQLIRLKQYLESHQPPSFDTGRKQVTIYPGGELKYLHPLYQLLHQENKFRMLAGDAACNDNLAQILSMLGDYSSAMQYSIKEYETVDAASQKQLAKTIESLQHIEHLPAEKYITFLAKNYRVIMVNEAHDKPQHRAFTLSLLEDLYKRGFRYLAMETFDNFSNHSLQQLNSFTGYYCNEPVAGELVRQALRLGYTLVSYEDTAAIQAHHSASQRDSIQAENLYSVIRHDSNARILVHAGFGHIAEKNTGDGYIPMALAFHRISGIDPLTVNQTSMTEESTFGYGRLLYQLYTGKFTVTEPSVALRNNIPLNITNNDLFDVTVIHPPTVYQDGRPTWLSLNGLRKGTYVKTGDTETFLVQAYYQEEYAAEKLSTLVPADQTYITNRKSNYFLYLRKGKYTVVSRNMAYQVNGTLQIEVN